MAVTEIRQALADAITTAFPDFQVSAYMLGNPVPPCFDVVPDGTTYHMAMADGAQELSFLVRAMVGDTSDIGAQQLLDRMSDSSGSASVKAAIEEDRTLGGVCDSLQVTLLSGYKTYVFEGRSPLLGVDWTVEVLV